MMCVDLLPAKCLESHQIDNFNRSLSTHALLENMSDDYTHFKSFPKISGFMNYKCFVCGLSLRNNQPENGYDKPDRINGSHHVQTVCAWNLNASQPLAFILCSVCVFEFFTSNTILHTYLTR